MAESNKPNENANNEEIVTLTKSEYDLLVARAAAQGENTAAAVIGQKAAEEPDKWYIRAGHAVRRAGHAVLVGLGTGVLVYTGARLLGLSGNSADDESDDDVPDVDDN